MFIKLTRLDQSPIWLNSAFIVTVEPRKGGGSIVVPVGDGLDYDVRESPEAVLALLGDAPSPAILPIPSKDALTPTPEDVSPEDEPAVNDKVAAAEPDEPAKPEKKPRKTAAKKPRTSRKKKPALPMEADQLERLRKMGPKSLKKLQNTLATQFKLENPDEAIDALVANEVFKLDENRVLWPEQ